MSPLVIIGAVLSGVGAAILWYGFPERKQHNPGPPPKRPTRCSLCGGGGLEYDEDGNYHPCRWRCWDESGVAA